MVEHFMKPFFARLATKTAMNRCAVQRHITLLDAL
jgi:hypothetical protein